MAISVVLSGAENDGDVLTAAACYAARQRCDLNVVLAMTFPSGTFLRRLDVALWRVAQLGLEAPQVIVERRRDRPKPQAPEAAGA